MNERIRELAEQAEVKWQHQEDVIYSTMTLEQFEKFAELIVAECIDAALEAQADYYVINNIKSRLGVEE
jgi:adenosyl cobinamide kinase/adenosyl cobinamide phosphate guanylyltransferase